MGEGSGPRDGAPAAVHTPLDTLHRGDPLGGGRRVDDALADEGPFHPIDVLLVGMQLAAALGHLHDRGLAHLDVKPGNVVLRDGRPVLIDSAWPGRWASRRAGTGAARHRGWPRHPGLRHRR